MKDILDRLGFYEFLGIWGPGAITITFYSFTLHTPLTKLLQFLSIENPGFTKGYITVIIYTVIAYMVGVVLHEIGKLWSDYVFRLSPQKCKSCADYLDVSPIPAIGIRREYKSAIEANIPKDQYDDISFDQANSGLRHNLSGDKKKAESYHAIYALSRSLFLCFFIHSLFVVGSLMADSICCKTGLLIIAADIALTLLFGIRTFRYYYAWIKNVFIQYHLVREDKPMKTAAYSVKKTLMGKRVK